MGKYDKLLERVLLGDADANIPFDELCQLLLRLGFEERIRGSHHIYRKAGVEEKINVQRDGGKAKSLIKYDKCGPSFCVTNFEVISDVQV